MGVSWPRRAVTGGKVPVLMPFVKGGACRSTVVNIASVSRPSHVVVMMGYRAGEGQIRKRQRSGAGVSAKMAPFRLMLTTVGHNRSAGGTSTRQIGVPERRSRCRWGLAWSHLTPPRGLVVIMRAVGGKHVCGKHVCLTGHRQGCTLPEDGHNLSPCPPSRWTTARRHRPITGTDPGVLWRRTT